MEVCPGQFQIWSVDHGLKNTGEKMDCTILLNKSMGIHIYIKNA